MRHSCDLVEIQSSNFIGGFCLERRPKLTVHVLGPEHDSDHVSSLSGGGLFGSEPTREDTMTETKVAVSPVSSSSSR
jgi:hypothetical protein